MLIPGFVGPAYTAQSNVAADEECINLYPETIESPGAQTQRFYLGTPGMKVFLTFPEGPVRGQTIMSGQVFLVSGSTLWSVNADGVHVPHGDVGNDTLAVSMAVSNTQILIISVGRAFCFTFATDTLTEVTSLLAGVPMQVEYSDGYFIVIFQDSNKFQISDILDGQTWPGIQVNAVSVFAENIISIIVSHRELWVMGRYHIQPYYNSGSDEVYDVIAGAMIDTGIIGTFGRNLIDNTIFWISQDQRGARQAWRANGYTPQRISTHAVEVALTSYAQADKVVSYAYQDGGHLFWVLYIPNADCSWVYDVAENLWHKRSEWHTDTAIFTPHRSWNHSYAYDRHLIGDWKTGTLFEMSLQFFDDAGTLIRRVRRSPIVVSEMNWIFHAEFTVDFAPGLGPQPPLLDGSGNPRQPMAMLRWSNDRGSTWSNEYMAGMGFAGQYSFRTIWRRLGRSRYRVYEVSTTEPIPITIVNAYLRVAGTA